MSSLYFPLNHNWAKSAAKTLPTLNFDPNSRFHTSAILASALHTATLPFRLSQNFQSMRHYVSLLTPFPRLNLVSLSAALPVTGLPNHPLYNPL